MFADCTCGREQAEAVWATRDASVDLGRQVVPAIVLVDEGDVVDLLPAMTLQQVAAQCGRATATASQEPPITDAGHGVSPPQDSSIVAISDNLAAGGAPTAWHDGAKGGARAHVQTDAMPVCEAQFTASTRLDDIVLERHCLLTTAHSLASQSRTVPLLKLLVAHLDEEDVVVRVLGLLARSMTGRRVVINDLEATPWFMSAIADALVNHKGRTAVCGVVIAVLQQCVQSAKLIEQVVGCKRVVFPIVYATAIDDLATGISPTVQLLLELTMERRGHKELKDAIAAVDLEMSRSPLSSDSDSPFLRGFALQLLRTTVDGAAKIDAHDAATWVARLHAVIRWINSQRFCLKLDEWGDACRCLAVAVSKTLNCPFLSAEHRQAVLADLDDLFESGFGGGAGRAGLGVHGWMQDCATEIGSILLHYSCFPPLVSAYAATPSNTTLRLCKVAFAPSVARYVGHHACTSGLPLMVAGCGAMAG